MNDKLIEKLAKLKAHAESAAKIGSQEEAAAFAAMFQDLCLKHKIEASEVEFKQQQEEPIDRSTVIWKNHDLPYGDRRIAWIETLAGIVARAYFCRILVRTGSSVIILVGKKSDREIAEYVLVNLVRAAEKLVRKEYQVFRKENPGEETKGFQVSFMNAFTNRLAFRFSEMRKAAETSTSTALVRINTTEAALAQYMVNLRTRSATGIGQSSLSNHAGAARGRAVADSMNLTGNGLNSGRNAGLLK